MLREQAEVIKQQRDLENEIAMLKNQVLQALLHTYIQYIHTYIQYIHTCIHTTSTIHTCICCDQAVAREIAEIRDTKPKEAGLKAIEDRAARAQRLREARVFTSIHTYIHTYIHIHIYKC